MVWQGEALAAVLTSVRLVVITPDFKVVAEVEELALGYPPISCSFMLAIYLGFQGNYLLTFLTSRASCGSSGPFFTQQAPTSSTSL